MIASNDKQGLKLLLENTQYKKKNDVFNSSEYREMYDATKLYTNTVKTESYVSKKSNDESEFWKGGKLAYDDKNMKDNVVYQTMSRAEHKEYEIPDNLKTTDHNMRVTRISEYSNALYNNNVFKNPRYLSC